MIDFEQKIDKIQNNIDLANFIETLLTDFIENRDTWQNANMESYLEAMEAWVRDCKGYYQNNNLDFPDEKLWKLVAGILLAAKIYE